MTPKRPLHTIRDEQAALGLPTIMDPTLAAAHGVTYVHLAVFAIDIDRVYWLEPEHPDLPFGWEVFLTEYDLLARLDRDDPNQGEMLETACANVLEETPGEPPLGGQLVFAVYDAFTRKQLGPEFASLFASWNQAPKDLTASLAQLWADADAEARALAEYCLAVELEPPLAAPTRASLERIAGSPACARST